ncbi:MAG: 50S ribosomal protein L9 [Lewinella sp.]|nr:50S ribosomal protein L9 [Lewinella sp.]
MDIILLSDVEHVGYKHDVVTVKDGYGRNYLIPQGMAIIANATNMARLDEMKRREDALEAKRLGEYQAIADKLADKVLKIGAKAGTSGKIFGSVTAIQVIAALKDQFDVDIDRRKVELPEEVKELGAYVMKLNLHKEVQPDLHFEVVAE